MSSQKACLIYWLPGTYLIKTSPQGKDKILGLGVSTNERAVSLLILTNERTVSLLIPTNERGEVCLVCLLEAGEGPLVAAHVLRRLPSAVVIQHLEATN